uniref:Uncharacterized protein n=1 Tax=Leersia perrieri TaxID=77586 RepID=A0A0D9XAL7_9ORYZ
MPSGDVGGGGEARNNRGGVQAAGEPTGDRRRSSLLRPSRRNSVCSNGGRRAVRAGKWRRGLHFRVPTSPPRRAGEDARRGPGRMWHVLVHKGAEHHLPDHKERPGDRTMPDSEDQRHAPHDGAIVQWKPSPRHPFPAGKDTHAVHRHASTLDTSGNIIDFSWYSFTTGAPAPVLSPAMIARARLLVDQLKDMVCK